MARTASYIDFKRLQKNSGLFGLSQDKIEGIYNNGLMTISSFDSFSFCYPIKYWDGILIRYFSSNILESADMIAELSGRLSGIIYISDSDGNLKYSLVPSGFKNYLKVYSIYKNNFCLPKKTSNFHIINYSDRYYQQLSMLDEEEFSFPGIAKYGNLSEFAGNEYSRIILCTDNDEVCGFCLYMLKPDIMYFYIIKIYVGISYRRKGAGTLLLKSVINSSKKYGYYPIFSNAFSDEPQPFLDFAGFTTWAESELLIKIK